MNSIQRILFFSALIFTAVASSGQFDPKAHAEKKAVEELIKTLGTITTTELSIFAEILREKHGLITPARQAEKTSAEKSQKLADIQVQHLEKQMELSDLQKKEAAIDLATKQFQLTREYCSLPGNSKFDKCIEYYKRFELKLQELNKDLPQLLQEDNKESSEVTPLSDKLESSK